MKIKIDSINAPVEGKTKSWQLKGNGKTFFSKDRIEPDWEGQTVEVEYEEKTFNDKKYLWMKSIKPATEEKVGQEGKKSDADLDSMYKSYSKDIVIAAIQAGKILDLSAVEDWWLHWFQMIKKGEKE